jgi:4-oxalocrotonate tautomerase
MPHIQISLAEGRSPEQIRSMIHEVALAVERTAGAPQAAISVHVTEVALEHWGNDNGTLREKRDAGAF